MMKQTLVMTLVMVYFVTNTRAQYTLTGAIDTEWLMDDPHKTDRLPIWGQLLGSQGHRSRATNNQSPLSLVNIGWTGAKGNSGNSWTQALQNLYRIMLWRQMLNNQNIISRATSRALPVVTPDNKPDRNTDQSWRNRLQNFYRIALWKQVLGNKSGSNAS